MYMYMYGTHRRSMHNFSQRTQWWTAKTIRISTVSAAATATAAAAVEDCIATHVSPTGHSHAKWHSQHFAACIADLASH